MIVSESIARDMLRLVVWYPVRWLVGAVPVKMGIRLLSAMGDIHYYLSMGKSKALGENIGRIQGLHLDKKHKDRIVREYLRNHYIDRLFIFIFPRLRVSDIPELVKIEGLENLDLALEKKKGVILVHGHFGPVHLPLVVLAKMGYPMKQIGYPSDEGLSWIGKNVAFRLRMKLEGLIPAEIIKTGSFLRGAFRWLNSNGIIMITGDGSGIANKAVKQAVIKYCGQPVLLPIGPSAMAAKTGAVILPMFITPGDGDKLYRIVIEPPIVQEVREEDILSVSTKFIRRLEEYVLQNVGYMHFLDIFKPGEFILKSDVVSNNK